MSKSYFYLLGALMLCTALLTTQTTFAQCPTLLWSDDFNGTNLDPNKWEPMIGTGTDYGVPSGWGNNELQYYLAENATVGNGILTIEAKNERFRGNNYTSARLRSKNLGDWTYGRFEARIKLPTGQGLWPAFWMLPTDEVYGGWPMSGEIDIMELVGYEPETVHGTIHYGDPYPDNQYQGQSFSLPNGIFNDGYHEFAIEWEAGVIKWFVDDNLYATKVTSDVSPYQWPFDQNFHFLLNVAVGGNWPGSPDATTVFPQSMEVDYVRVYDAGKLYISGTRTVTNQASGVQYLVGNTAAATSYSWTVPAGASIVSGQGTSSITVDWGTAGGDVIATVGTACGSESLVMNVVVEAPYFYNSTFINYDDPDNITFNSTTGTYSPDVANPDNSGLNASALSAQYVRNSGEVFDVLVFDVSTISTPQEYVDESRRFYLDVYTDAPVGTLLLLQLEDSNIATAINFPDGRHSRYEALTTVQNQWQRLEFKYLDRPDGATSNVDKFVLLPASNSNDGSTYYLDNFDSYSIDGGSQPNQAPTVAITDPASGADYTVGSTVSISATANDSDGTVSQVEFFVDGTSIGTDNTSPYATDWTIPAVGAYILSATATDNESAQTSSASITINGTSTASATSMHVSSILTSTVNAGQGKKRGRASIDVVDNLGSPVANATVSGTFSGSFSESVSGTTDAAGNVTFTTAATAVGGVTVDFCVDNVTHATLTYASQDNTITCTGGSNFNVIPTGLEAYQSPRLVDVQPVPFVNNLQLAVEVPRATDLSVEIYDVNGRLIYNKEVAASAGHYQQQVDASSWVKGSYLLKITTDENVETRVITKQ